MTLTTIDDRTALVLIDLQNGVMGLTGAPHTSTVTRAL
jgi:nicotinamidase-related amidase